MVFFSFASIAKNTISMRFYGCKKCEKSAKNSNELTFDEDDFVVFLGLSNWNLTLWENFLWLWWWNVHVDVLLHNGCTASTRWVSTKTAAAAASTETATAASTCIDNEKKKNKMYHHLLKYEMRVIIWFLTSSSFTARSLATASFFKCILFNLLTTITTTIAN